MTTTQTTTPPHELVWSITTSCAPARAIHIAAELGIADHIGGDPVPVGELAGRCGVDAGALDRVLRLLASIGIFERAADADSHGDGGYRHSEASRLLRDDHPMSMRAFARMIGLPVMWDSFGALGSSLRTGSPAIDQIAPGGLWAYLQRHPDEARTFDEAMTAKARADIAAVLDAYDFRSFRTIADIGGGRGHLLQAILDAAPSARGVLFDLPPVIESLDVASPRLTFHSGDFFVDPLPTADAYVLMEIIHDWPDGQALAILRAIRRAAKPGAVVLVIEATVPDHPDPRVHTLDLIMLAVTGGRERTAGQLGRLFHEAGFHLSAVVDTAGQVRVVEAVAV